MGMKNLAGAIAVDPTFASQTKGVMSKAEAAQLVQDPLKGGNKAPAQPKKGS